MAIQYSILSKDQIRSKIGLDGIFKISNEKLLQKKKRLRNEDADEGAVKGAQLHQAPKE